MLINVFILKIDANNVIDANKCIKNRQQQKKSIMITNLERLKIVYNYKIIDANKYIYFIA